MPINWVDKFGNRVRWGGDRSTPDAPPAAPTGLQAEAGNGEVTLTWNANTEGDLADYLVRLVSPSDSLIATVPAGITSYTHTGRTNGQAYQYAVRARDAAGNVSDNSNLATATPLGGSGTVTTVFGINTNESDTSAQTLAGRKVWFADRVPCVRRYNSGYLTTDTFNITTAVAPERRVAYSFTANSTGTYTKAGLASGAGNARLTAWCSSIPTGWTVYLTYYHEVGGYIRGGSLTVSDYLSAYAHFRDAIDAASLKAGVTVYLVSNFMAHQVADPLYFSQSWVPPEADIMTFDVYGNPGHFTTATGTNKYGTGTGSGLGTTYPPPDTRFADMFNAIETAGFADSWGILEINAPARTWDTTENGRKLWHQDAIDLLLTPPMAGAHPPKIILPWEGPSGVSFNQAYGSVSGNALTVANVWKPYFTSIPKQ